MITKRQLYRLYYTEHLSLRRCGLKLGISTSSVRQYMVKYGFKSRDKLIEAVASNTKDLTGKRFYRLVAIRPARTSYVTPGTGVLRAGWLCKCDCGKTVVVPTGSLRRNGQHSCGCYTREVNKMRVGAKHPCWRGGKTHNHAGYVLVWCPGHPNAIYYDKRYALEHVYVMAKKLGRPVVNDERIHHKNGIKTDNRLENLELWTKNHPIGGRVEDVTAFAIAHLTRYAPEALAHN